MSEQIVPGRISLIERENIESHFGQSSIIFLPANTKSPITNGRKNGYRPLAGSLLCVVVRCLEIMATISEIINEEMNCFLPNNLERVKPEPILAMV